MIKAIAQYIENETDFTIGTDLWPGFIPASDEGDGIALIESGGVPNFYLTDAKAKAVQVISRASDYQTARDNAQTIFELLHGAAGITLPVVDAGEAYYVNTIEAISDPQSLGQDEKGLFIISTNYIFRMQDA